MENKIWITQEELNNQNEFFSEMKENLDNYLMWGTLPKDQKTEEEKYIDDLKLAYVKIDSKQKMVNVHNKNMKAYKSDGVYYELNLPLEEIIYESFVRWVRPMDM